MSNFFLGSDIKSIAENISNVSSMLERKTVLITGGSGFLGKYLTEIINYLNENYFQEPCYVIVMDNQIISNDFDFEWTEKANIKLLKHDAIREFKWKKKIDYIIHAAGIASPYFYRRFPKSRTVAQIPGLSITQIVMV